MKPTTPSICSICHVGSLAKYTCPRCYVEYCSVTCYRNHSAISSSSTTTTTSSCTEAFYQHRVSQVLQYEQQEEAQSHQRKHATLRMLQRVHEDRSITIMDDDDEEEADVSPSQRQESLHHLLWLLDHELRQPWHPWWLPELTSGSSTMDDHDNVNDDAIAVALIDGKTLDEHLLEIPPFVSLRPKQLQEQQKQLQLQYNLIDILHATVITLRQYKGLQNNHNHNNNNNNNNMMTTTTKESRATTVLLHAATTTLIHTSAVLSRDARFTSLEEVLMECTTTTTTMNMNTNTTRTTGTHVHVHVHVHDVAALCQYRRMVVRALLEAREILQQTICILKTNKTTSTLLLWDRSHLKRIVKKIEYYMSWANAQQQQPQLSTASLDWNHLSHQLQQWITDWSLPATIE